MKIAFHLVACTLCVNARYASMAAMRQWPLRVNRRYALMDATRQWTLSPVQAT